METALYQMQYIIIIIITWNFYETKTQVWIFFELTHFLTTWPMRSVLLSWALSSVVEMEKNFINWVNIPSHVYLHGVWISSRHAGSCCFRELVRLAGSSKIHWNNIFPSHSLPQQFSLSLQEKSETPAKGSHRHIKRFNTHPPSILQKVGTGRPDAIFSMINRAAEEIKFKCFSSRWESSAQNLRGWWWRMVRSRAICSATKHCVDKCNRQR